MKKMISCLAILTLLASTVSCGSTESGATTESLISSPKTTAVTTTESVMSKANKITTTAVNKKSDNVKSENKGNSTIAESSKLGNSIFGGYVTADTAVKKTADANSETLLTIPDGTQIGVFESGIEGWFMTDFKETVGYIPANNVKEITPFDPAVGGDNVLGGSVTRDINLMSGTHSYAESLITIPNGTQVNYYLLPSDANWCVVNYQNKIGYVESKYIKAIEKYNMADESSIGQHSGDDFLGTWSVGRIYITIVKSGAGYEASVKWSSSAAESTNWTYSCEFNGEYLDSTNGRCVDSIYDENGNESATIRYTNGCAHFRLNGNGNLIWEELRDNTVGADTELMKISCP